MTESPLSEKFAYRSRLNASAETVYRWHALPDALQRLTPPWEKAEVLEQTGSIEQIGSRVGIRVGIGPISQIWTSEHTACDPGRMFEDSMVSGPFRRWVHTHLFIADGQGASWLEDRVEYEIPFGWLGRIVAGAYIKKRLGRMFAWRHRRTAEALAEVLDSKKI
jgi:ligand-binding SRPBCC domain-containing protein